MIRALLCGCLALLTACAGAIESSSQATSHLHSVRGRVLGTCDGAPLANVEAALFTGSEGRLLATTATRLDGTFVVRWPKNQGGSMYYVHAAGALRLFDANAVEQGTEIIVLAPCPKKS